MNNFARVALAGCTIGAVLYAVYEHIELKRAREYIATVNGWVKGMEACLDAKMFQEEKQETSEE